MTLIRLPLSSVETMMFEEAWNYENLIEEVLEFWNELARIRAWSHMSKRVNPSWKQVTDDTPFPFPLSSPYPPLSL